MNQVYKGIYAISAALNSLYAERLEFKQRAKYPLGFECNFGFTRRSSEFVVTHTTYTGMGNHLRETLTKVTNEQFAYKASVSRVEDFEYLLPGGKRVGSCDVSKVILKGIAKNPQLEIYFKEHYQKSAKLVRDILIVPTDQTRVGESDYTVLHVKLELSQMTERFNQHKREQVMLAHAFA